MNKIQLTSEQRELLRTIQRQTKDKRVYRKVSVILGLDINLTVQQLVSTLGLEESTIKRYKKAFQKQGLKNYLEDAYKPYSGQLNSQQLLLLVKELNKNLYTTTTQVADWIYQAFGIRYKSNSVRALLKRLGFSYKKTKLIPGKADAAAQREFVKSFKKLESNLKENEVIYFGDGVHPQHNTQPAYAWIAKGKEKQIKSNTGRTRINLHGAVNAHDVNDIIVKEHITLDATETIKFFKKIEQANPDKSKIYMVIDNARYYRNKRVMEYLKQSKIEIIFLPPYSPNLNLIERLWKFMKKTVIHNKYYEKPTEFRKKLLDFFENINVYEKELQSLLTLNFQIIDSS